MRVGAPAGLEFLGSSGAFEKGQVVAMQRAGVEGTLGGFSGLSFDTATVDEWWMISDRGGKLWKVAIELGENGRLAGPGAVSWLDVLQIRTLEGSGSDARCPYGECTELDAEGVAAGCTDDGSLLVSTEGPADVLSVDSTGVLRGRGGTEGASVWAPCSSGAGDCINLHQNKMLESLTCLRDYPAADLATRLSHVAFTGFERPMVSDGDTRIVAIDATNGELLKAVRYHLDPKAFDDSDDTGLVDLEAIPDPNSVGYSGTGFQEEFTVVMDGGQPSSSRTGMSRLNSTRLLSMERSYSALGGWSIRLYLTAPLSSATDVAGCSFGRPNSCPVDGSSDPVLQKYLLLDLLQEASTLGVECDNYEAMALGPLLPDGRQVLLLVNDDNCAQINTTKCWAGNVIGTQFLAFAFDVNAAVSEMQTRQSVQSLPRPSTTSSEDPVHALLVAVPALLFTAGLIALGAHCVKRLCTQKRLKAEALLQLEDVEHGVEDAFSEDPSPRAESA